MPICWNTLLQWCLDTYYVRQVTDAVLRARCRYTLARFEQQRPSQAQEHTLAGLIHRGQATRFGRDHDFRRIGNVADFRRLVPLRTAAELWRDYWQPAHPSLDGATWRGPAMLEGGGTPRLHLTTPALVDATRRVLNMALAFVIDARPAARLLSGQTLLLGDDLPLSLEDSEGGLSLRPAYGVRGLPRLLRRYTLLAREATSEVSVHAARLPITCLAGSPYQIATLFDRIKELSGRDRIADVWPQLTAILSTRPLSDSLHDQLREEVGSGPVVLEMQAGPEAVLAIEDPRYELPRLMHHQGVFLEFVPVSEVDHPRATRLGFDEVQTGTPYEVAVTTPAGLWACRVGCAVVFERLDPPLVSFVEAPRPLSRRTDLAPVTGPTQPPHPQTAGTRAALPETAVHTPWSAPADQG